MGLALRPRWLEGKSGRHHEAERQRYHFSYSIFITVIPPHTDICDLWATGLRPGCVGVCAHVWWDSWGVMDRRGRGCVSGSVRVSEGGRGGATQVDGCYHLHNDEPIQPHHNSAARVISQHV